MQESKRVERAFRAAFVAQRAEGDGTADLVPTYLVRAAARVLPVDGASISFVHADLRVPLGADSEASAIAERLQFTVGDGPCMQAGREGMVIDAPQVLLRTRWPALADEWQRLTPYRSATSVPIPVPTPTRAALNLFFTGTDTRALRPVHAIVISTLIATELVGSVPQLPVAHLLRTPHAASRLRVWLAVGLVMQAHKLVAGDALARLRAHAYALEVPLDTVADELVVEPERAHTLAL